jgi:hypothetical protein
MAWKFRPLANPIFGQQASERDEVKKDQALGEQFLGI